jgi:hypothetical protein
MKRYNLEAFGLNKTTLKRILNLGEIANEEFAAECDALLSRRGKEYSLDELSKLNDMTYLAHHDCVLDNPDDYTRIEVHNTKERIRKHAEREAQIARYRLLEQAELAGHKLGTWTFVILPAFGYQPAFFGGHKRTRIEHSKEGLPVYKSTCTHCGLELRSDAQQVPDCGVEVCA